MNKRQKKKIEKKIAGIQKQIEKHQEKIRTFAGRKDTTKDYWKKEVKQFEEEKSELEDKKDE